MWNCLIVKVSVLLLIKVLIKLQENYIMNKVMILAILVAYKAFNDKSLTIATNECVYSDVIIGSIDDMFVTISSKCNANDDIYTYTININSIVGIQFQKQY